MPDEGPAPDARMGIELFAETTRSTCPQVVDIRLLGEAGARSG